MKDIFLKSFSYLFHPVFIPFLGVVFYFSKTRRSIPQELLYAKLFSVFILTVILPILIFFFLRTLKVITSFNTLELKERAYPLLINCFILILILYRVFPRQDITGLYFFFLGLLCATLVCFLLIFMRIKASLHLMGMTSFFIFCILVGIYYQKNINGTVALLLFCLGGLATSRLHLKAHTIKELICGAMIGGIPQLGLFYFWVE